MDLVEAGAWVVNLSLGLEAPFAQDIGALTASCDYAFRRGVLLVAASGNQGHVGPTPLFTHPWVIPVAACTRQGRLRTESNIGPSVGRRGLRALGTDVHSLAAPQGYTIMSGTSVAAPFVTGTIALLWSLFPRATAAVHAKAAEMFREDKALSRVEVRPSRLSGTRTIVQAIFVFTDRSNSVEEKYLVVLFDVLMERLLL